MNRLISFLYCIAILTFLVGLDLFSSNSAPTWLDFLQNDKQNLLLFEKSRVEEAKTKIEEHWQTIQDYGDKSVENLKTLKEAATLGDAELQQQVDALKAMIDNKVDLVDSDLHSPGQIAQDIAELVGMERSLAALGITDPLIDDVLLSKTLRQYALLMNKQAEEAMKIRDLTDVEQSGSYARLLVDY